MKLAIYGSRGLGREVLLIVIAKSLNIETDPTFKVIREIFEIKVINKNSFNLIVKGNSVKILKIVDVCLKDVNNKITDYCKNNYNFESILISSGIGEIANLKDLQKNEVKKLEELQIELNKAKIDLSSVVEPVKFDNNEKLETPESYKLKKLLLYIFAGFSGGIFIALSYFTCKYLFEGKLRDEDYVSNAFGIVKICSIYKYRNANILDNSGLKKLGSYIDYLYENGIRSIRFVSTLDKDLCSELSVFISDVKSRLNADICIISAAEISEAAKADAVILFEKTDISNLNEVVDEVKSILAVKEKISGIVYG